MYVVYTAKIIVHDYETRSIRIQTVHHIVYLMLWESEFKSVRDPMVNYDTLSIQDLHNILYVYTSGYGQVG